MHLTGDGLIFFSGSLLCWGISESEAIVGFGQEKGDGEACETLLSDGMDRFGTGEEAEIDPGAV